MNKNQFNSKMETTMFCIFFIVIFLYSSCNDENLFYAKSKYQIAFDTIVPCEIEQVNIFATTTYIALETSEDCLLSSHIRMKPFNSDYYIMDSKSQNKVFRFAANGKFMNSIGSIGKGVNEYLFLHDFAINLEKGTIELLTGQNNKLINRYTVEGQWISKIETNIPAQSFSVLEDNYLLNIGYSNFFSKERLYLLTNEGDIVDKFHPITTNRPRFDEPNFFQINQNEVMFHESLCNAVFKITPNGITPWYSFDFGNYNISTEIHTMSFYKSTEFMHSKGMRCIVDYSANNDFEYFFIVQLKDGEQGVLYHLLVNKENRNIILLKAPPYLSQPAVLNNHNELLFLMFPSDALDFVKKYSSFEGNIHTFKLNEDMNPLIVKIKINPF